MIRKEPPRVPGIIDGTMTIHPEPGGSVSLRVIVGTDDGTGARHDLLELIIGADDIPGVSRVLSRDGTASDDGQNWRHPFPCHIGFLRHSAHSAA